MTKRKRPAPPEVRPGQIWADASARGRLRSIRVDTVEHGYATCTTLTNSYEVQRGLDLAAKGLHMWNVRDMRGSKVRIRVDRFRPTANGYYLITSNGAATDYGLRRLLDGEFGTLDEFDAQSVLKDFTDAGIHMLLRTEETPVVTDELLRQLLDQDPPSEVA